jgi:hypothetical protein
VNYLSKVAERIVCIWRKKRPRAANTILKNEVGRPTALNFKIYHRVGMVMYACNLSTQEAEGDEE